MASLKWDAKVAKAAAAVISMFMMIKKSENSSVQNFCVEFYGQLSDI